MRIRLSYQEFLAEWPDTGGYLRRQMRFLQAYHSNYVTGDPHDPEAVLADFRQVWTEERVAQLRQRVEGVDVPALVRQGCERAAAVLSPREMPDVICAAGLFASNASQYLIGGRPVIGLFMELWGGAIAGVPCPWEDLPLVVAHEFGHVVRYAEGDCHLGRVARPDFHLPRALAEVPILEFLIDEGLAQSVAAAAYPEADETRVLMFSPDQLGWARENFGQLWQEVSQRLDQPPGFSGFKRYFSMGAGELPPRLGYYIGWRLVQDFLSRNPQIRLAEAVRMPAEAFLQ